MKACLRGVFVAQIVLVIQQDQTQLFAENQSFTIEMTVHDQLGITGLRSISKGVETNAHCQPCQCAILCQVYNELLAIQWPHSTKTMGI